MATVLRDQGTLVGAGRAFQGQTALLVTKGNDGLDPGERDIGG